jgi:hypothetical protein
MAVKQRGRDLIIVLVTATAGCAPVALTPVSQPITCDCPWQTEVFAGTFDGGSGGDASGHPPVGVQVLLESRPGQTRVSFLVPTKGAACTLLASTGAAIDPGQDCSDPSAPDVKVTIQSGTWSKAPDGSRLHVTYDWRSAPHAAPSHATFEGAATRLPAAARDLPPLCETRLLPAHG